MIAMPRIRLATSISSHGGQAKDREHVMNTLSNSARRRREEQQRRTSDERKNLRPFSGVNLIAHFDKLDVKAQPQCSGTDEPCVKRQCP